MSEGPEMFDTLFSGIWGPSDVFDAALRNEKLKFWDDLERPETNFAEFVPKCNLYEGIVIKADLHVMAFWSDWPLNISSSLQIKVVDRAKERRIFEEIVRKLDKRENDSLPQVKLDKHEVSW